MTPDPDRDASDDAAQRDGGDKQSRLGDLLSPLQDPRVAGAVGALVVGGAASLSGGLPGGADQELKPPDPGADDHAGPRPPAPGNERLIVSFEGPPPPPTHEMHDAHDAGLGPSELSSDVGQDPSAGPPV